MPRLIIENERGQQLELTNNESKFSIDSITGLAPPTAELSFTENINDGAEFKHERTSKRNIVINLYINGAVERNRIELYNYVKNGKYIKIYFSNKSRSVWIDGRVETIEPDLFNNHVTCMISIICPDPWWKDVEEAISEMNTVQGKFYFPFYTVAPIPFSIYETIQILNMLNKGDVASGMTIEIYARGTIENIKIYNRETTEFIGLGTTENPFTLNAGDKVVITTHQNNKKIKLIRNAIETNIFNYLTPNSTFLQAESGDNIFTYTADSGNEYIDITFRRYSQYEGV